jgi:CHAT domain
MNKLLLLLIMPFFIGCGTDAAKEDNMAPLLRRLLTEKKTDSLALLGPGYKWSGDYKDSGFRNYIVLNSKIGDSILAWDNKRGNKASIYFDNIIQQGAAAARSDSLLFKIYLYALGKWMDQNSAYEYDEKKVRYYKEYLSCNPQLTKDDIRDYFSALQNLGIIYNVLGEKALAIKYYDEALQYAMPQKWPNKIASASINRYSFFTEYQLYDSVISNAAFALSFPGIETKRIATIKAYYAEALYENHDPGYLKPLNEAWDSLQHILYKDMGADQWGKKSDVLKLYGKIALNENKYDLAKHYFKMALDTCMKKNIANDDPRYERSYAKLLLNMAAVYDSNRQYDSALYYSQFALSCVTKADSADISSNPRPVELYTENTIMEALDAKAGLLQKKYNQQKDIRLLENAVECHDLAFEVERKLTDNFTYDTSRAAMQEQSKIRSSAAIKNCYTLYSITNDKKWAEKAFRFSENSKALLMLEAVKQNIFYNKNLNDDPDLKKLDSLKLQYAYVEKLLGETKDSITNTTLESRKKELGLAVDAAIAALEPKNLSYKKLTESADTNLLPLVKKDLLSSNRSLVEFFCNGTDNYVFIINQTEIAGFYQLDTAISKSADSLLNFFDAPGTIANNEVAYKKMAFRLYQAMGLQHLPLATTSLLIIPDGSFYKLPFDALLTENDTTTGLKRSPYLLNRFATSNGYSAASLLQQERSEGSSGETVAFAPEFLQGERNLAPLLQTAREVESIGADKVYSKKNADVAAFKKALGTAGIIHLATHAGLDSLGTIPRLEFADSSFLINELYARRINTNLVMLNACQTNKGKIHESEGALSLARGFYYAGAKNVVASLWNVDDLSGAKIAEGFYRQAKNNGNDFGAALHQAKKDFLADNPGGTRYSPYYWAALMHIGGPEKPQGASAIITYGAVTGVVLFLLMFLIARKRKKEYAVKINQPAVSRLTRREKKRNNF